MKFIHSITISVFVKPNEDKTLFKEAIKKLVPFSLEKEKITISEQITEGFEEKITILRLLLTKDRLTNAFLENIKSLLLVSDIKALKTQENRLDEDCKFFFRLDKKALLEGNCKLTDTGDCFHIKMSIAAFPKKRAIAIKLVKEMFK